MFGRSKPPIQPEPPVNGPVVVSGGKRMAWWRKLYLKVFPQSLTSWRGILVIAGAVVGLAASGAVAVLAYKALNKPAEPLSVATDVTEAGLKIDTNGDGKPDATIPKDAPADGAATNPGTGGQPAASGGGTTGGGSGGAGGGGGSGGGSTAQTNCEPHPDTCGYPYSGNTGVPAGTALTLLDLPAGYMDVTVPGTVIEGKDVRGCIIVKAANVTIRNSKVSCPDYYVIYNSRSYYSGGGLLIENVDLSCKDSSGNPTQGTGISDYGFTARKVNIHDCENGVSISDSATLEDSYIHDLYEGASGSGHADGVQMSDTPYGVLIQRNSIIVPGTTAAVNWTGQTTSVTMQNNFLAGGAYTVYCPTVSVPSGAYKVLNNRFGSYAFGHSDSCTSSGVVFTGNFKDSDLSAISAQ